MNTKHNRLQTLDKIKIAGYNINVINDRELKKRLDKNKKARYNIIREDIK